jgi:hypothetical protein
VTLRESQAFITRMMRDEHFRAEAEGPGFDSLADQFGLDAVDRQQIRALDFAEFGRFAEYARDQRMRRRIAEYALFLNHIGRFCDLSTFFREYHQTVTHGQGARLEEMRRFDNFAMNYIVDGGLPDYLFDLVRFCSAACEYGETPKVWPAQAAAGVTPESIGANYEISLRRPYTVITFRHDVLRIADEADEYSLEPLPRRTVVLVQRDWGQHKRCFVFSLRDHPMLACLAKGPLRLADLAADLPDFSYATALRLVRMHHESGHLHATPPEDLQTAVPSGSPDS